MPFFTPRPCVVLCVLAAFGGTLWGQSAPLPEENPILLDARVQRHPIVAQAASQGLVFQNLVPGEAYVFALPGDPEGCPVEVTAVELRDAAYDESRHVVSFTAPAAQVSFRLNYGCDWNPADRPAHYVSLVCQSCRPKEAAARDAAKSDAALLSVGPGGTPEELVKNVLIGGNCFDVSNVVFKGDSTQIGVFSNGSTNIGVESGIILSTGHRNLAVGPNTVDDADAGYSYFTPDNNLAQLSGSNFNYDIASLEFDFTPTETPVSFEYVFASEEYCEYVGTQFNDAFGFFISGPGISGPFSGSDNIAEAGPGTYVAINNVNHLSFANSFVNNTPAGHILCGQNGATGQAVSEVQYDGFTKVLTAVADVIPCQTYRIRLKVCDIGDGIYDSAVFLRAGSFNGGGSASVSWVVNGNAASQASEGCGTVQLVFRRIGANTSQPIVVTYQILGTALSPADYTGIPLTVTIPAGQSQVTVPVTIFDDLIAEGQESIVIRLDNPCSCQNPEQILLVNDVPALTAVADTLVICNPGTVQLGVDVLSGVAPYTYQWSGSGGTGSTISPFANATANYTVTVTDACGRSVVRTARVILTSPPSGQLLPPAPQICPGGSGVLQINFNGVGPFNITYTLDGMAQQITGITSDPFSLTVNQPGNYVLTQVSTTAGCIGTASGSMLVTQSTLNVAGTAAGTTCAGLSNGAINTTVTGGAPAFSYTWTGPQVIGNVADPSGLAAGTYQVVVSDGAGCTDSQQFTVAAPAPIVPAVGLVSGASCASPDGGSIDLTVSGGTPGYSYLWTGNLAVQDPQNLAPGDYTVVITDANNCTATTTATVPGDFTPPVAMAGVDSAITCKTPALTLDGSGSSTGPDFSYEWATTDGLINENGHTLFPGVGGAGTYLLTVLDNSNGCTASTQVVVASDTTAPMAHAGPDQTLTCTVLTATLDGSASGAGTNLAYQWSASGGGEIEAGETTLHPIVDQPGTYTLVVTDMQNGCSATSTVAVTGDTSPPAAIIEPAALFSCTLTSIPLSGVNSTTTGGISYEWTTTDGHYSSGLNGATATVTEPGNYTLIVTDNANGCTSSATVAVGQDNSVPLAVATVNGQLDCDTEQLTLDGTASSSGNDFAYSWTASDGGMFESGENTLNPVINAPGTYTLLITNTLNDCTASATLVVAADDTPPPALAGAPGVLTCVVDTLTLGEASAGPAYVYAWTASNGGTFVSGENTATPVVNSPGTYHLLVSDPANGCTNTDEVVISANTTPPTALVAPNTGLNCLATVIQLNGSGSSAGPGIEYHWTSSTGAGIAAGQSTPTPTITTAGDYTLTVLNTANGCTAAATATVNAVADQPLAAALQPDTLNCTTTAVTIDASGSSTGPEFEYVWGSLDGQITAGQGSLQITVDEPGIYTLLVTNTANSCTATLDVEVPADLAAPTADAGQTIALDCTQPAQTLDGNGSSQGAQFQYVWTAVSGGHFVSATDVLNPAIDAPGTYELLVTNVLNGCTAASTVLVNGDPNAPVVSIATPAQLDCNTSQVQLNAAGTSTGGNFTYAWIGPGAILDADSLTPTVSQAGDYTVLVTNTLNNCTSTETVTVPENLQPPVANAGASPAQLDCAHQQVQLDGTGSSTGPAFTYLWTGPGLVSGAAELLPVVDQAGQYNLLVTDTTNGCSAVSQVALSGDFSLPAADAGPGAELDCQLTSYVMAASASQGPEFSYLWDTDSGSFTSAQNILNPTVNGAGTYFLTVTNTVNSCTAVSSVQITQDSTLPVASAGTAGNLSCAVTTLSLNGSGSSAGAQYAYAWSTLDGNIVSGDSTLSPLVDQPGVYILAVTNTATLCTTLSQVTVGEDVAPPATDAGQPVVLTCAVPVAPLQGSVGSNGNFTYQWQTADGNILSGANSLSPVVDSGGTYTLSVTNTLNGCSATDQVQVSVDQAPPQVAVTVGGLLNCAVDEITINASASGGSDLQYDWTTTGGHFTDLTDPLAPSVDAPGTYQLTVWNADNGCEASALAAVGQNIEAPDVDAGSDALITCTTTLAQLNGTASGIGNIFYQWNTSDGQILTGQNSADATVTAGGTYTLTVVDEGNGCSNSDQVDVASDTQQPAAVVATPGMLTCLQTQVTLNGAGSATGAGITYSWTTSDGNILSGSNGLQATVNASGAYTLHVFDSDNGCSSAVSVIVDDNIVLPNAEAGPTALLTCTVDEVTLQGSGSTGSSFQYAWSAGAGGQIVSGGATLSPVVDRPGLYTLTVTNQTTGCSQTDVVEILQETNLPTGFLFDLQRPSCKDNDGMVSFTQVNGGVGPYLYSIDGGNTFTSEPDFGNIAPGALQLMIQDANGCEFQQNLTVPPTPDPGVSTEPEFSITLGESLDLVATLAPGYSPAHIDTVIWTPMTGLTFESNSVFDLLQPTAQPFQSTEYTVTIIGIGGCEASDRVLVRVDDEPHIYIPNAFSPWSSVDDNGVNDVVYISADPDQVTKVHLFRIYDRWGEVVYENHDFQPNDPAHGWNGYLGSRLMSPAVFAYVIEIDLIDGRREVFKGDVTLVR